MFTICKFRLQQNINFDFPIVSFNNKIRLDNKIQSTNKRFKLIKYFKDKIVRNSGRNSFNR